MGELKLEGSLRLEGVLHLGKMVLAGASELVVPLTPLGARAHSNDGEPRVPLPKDGPGGEMIWLTGSANTTVTVGGKPAITVADVMGAQGPASNDVSGTAVVISGKCEIEIAGALALVKGDNISIGATTMTLKNSGQS